MKVKITHTDGKTFNAEAANGSFVIDPSKVTPLEYFALGLISCSGVDIVSMAEKKQNCPEKLLDGSRICQK